MAGALAEGCSCDSVLNVAAEIGGRARGMMVLCSLYREYNGVLQ